MQDRVLTWAGPVLLLAAAFVPALRPVVTVALVVGWASLRRSRQPAAVAWAAVLPVGIAISWPWILGVDVPLGDPACTDPLSMIAVRRMVVAVVGLTVVALLGSVHGSGLAELGLARPGRRDSALALAGVVGLAAGGLVVGPWLARPFFGPLDFPTPAAAIVPAVLFGVANGVLEEVAYRGAMQAWLAHVLPLARAIAVQGLVFGIVHAGPEVLALLPLHVALMSVVGVAGGVARARFGSLWIPIGVHVGADIALYPVPVRYYCPW
jgi:membrane protease YdiL (CAAX protease family)